MDCKLREKIFSNFKILRVNIFEERVFPDTLLTVCLLSFVKIPKSSMPFKKEREKTKFVSFVPSKKNLFMPGGDIKIFIFFFKNFYIFFKNFYIFFKNFYIFFKNFYIF